MPTRRCRIGLVNRIVPAEKLLDESRALLRTILAQGPTAVRLCLESVTGGSDLGRDEALAMEAALFGAACDTADRAEGTAGVS